MSKRGYTSKDLYCLAVDLVNAVHGLIKLPSCAYPRGRRLTNTQEACLAEVAKQYGIDDFKTCPRANYRLKQMLTADLQSLKVSSIRTQTEAIACRLDSIVSLRSKQSAVPTWALGVYEVVQHVVTHFNLEPRSACRRLVKQGLPVSEDIDDGLKRELHARWEKLIQNPATGSGAKRTGKGADRADPDSGRIQWLLNKYKQECLLKRRSPGLHYTVCGLSESDDWDSASVTPLFEDLPPMAIVDCYKGPRKDSQELRDLVAQITREESSRAECAYQSLLADYTT